MKATKLAMKENLKVMLGTRFMTQPIDIPVALFNVVFVFSALVTAVAIAANIDLVINGNMPVLETVTAPLWVALLSGAMRDGIAEAHHQIDVKRGIIR